MHSPFQFLLVTQISVLATLACGPSGMSTPDAQPQDPQGSDAALGDSGVPAGGPRVILMIGDGMGRGQLAAATARAGALFMPTLPSHGEIVTGSLSGITDSAAAATTMATGIRTFNTRIGMGPAGEDLETLVELARKQNMASGIVTTAHLSHATPASFTAYQESRHDYDSIAFDQTTMAADIMLGGGNSHFASHLDSLRGRGFQVVTSANQLDQATSRKVFGVFSDEHMDYVIDRSANTSQPTLSQMSLKALDLLEKSEDGFFLMIEGARIDMASHLNDYERALTETIAFDEAVREVSQWAAQRPDVLLLITADHECGGLAHTPEVTWRWQEHTNARVDIFGSGTGSEIFDNAVLDHRWVHAALKAKLLSSPLVEPATVLVPDGHLEDLRHRVVDQTRTSDFGVGENQLDALWLDANERGLAIGIEGLFQWQSNAVNVLVDIDFGTGSGVTSFSGTLSDTDGVLDSIVSSSRLSAPALAGFGAELVLSSWGGMEVHHEVLQDTSGARGVAPPYGASNNLGWHQVAINFGEAVRSQGPISSSPGEGFEAFIPWTSLYPELGGSVPAGAKVAVAAVLVNNDGGYTSNQALPPFAESTGSPGRSEVALPGVVEFLIDSNQDGVGDGNSVPVVVTE